MIIVYIMAVKGGGIRTFASKNDSEEPESIVKLVFVAKSKTSEFHQKMYGYKHVRAIVMPDGTEAGKFSFRWVRKDTPAGAAL